MKRVAILAVLALWGGGATAQVLPAGSAVVRASNGETLGRVVDFEREDSPTSTIMSASLALTTLSVDGETGIAAVRNENLTFESFYAESDCVGPPHVFPSLLTQSGPPELKFSSTPFFLTDGGGETLYRIDPTVPPSLLTVSYAWQVSTQSCILFPVTADLLVGVPVDPGFGASFPPPYRLGVEPGSPALAAAVPAVGPWGLLALVSLLAGHGLLRLRGRRRRFVGSRAPAPR